MGNSYIFIKDGQRVSLIYSLKIFMGKSYIFIKDVAMGKSYIYSLKIKDFYW